MGEVGAVLDIGVRLQIVRRIAGYSQRELAKRANVTNSTISLIEQGRVSPSVSSLQKVLSGIPMSLADFFEPNLLTIATLFIFKSISFEKGSLKIMVFFDTN